MKPATLPEFLHYPKRLGSALTVLLMSHKGHGFLPSVLHKAHTYVTTRGYVVSTTSDTFSVTHSEHYFLKEATNE